MGRYKKLILVLAITILFSGCNGVSQKRALKVPKLATSSGVSGKLYKVSAGSISNLITCDGIVSPLKQQFVGFKYGRGIVNKINAHDKDKAKKGDVLAELDNDEIIDKIKIQELQLKKAELSYEEMVNKNADEDAIKQASLDVESQKLQLVNIKAQLENCKIIVPFDGEVSMLYGITIGSQATSEPVYCVKDSSQMYIKCTGEIDRYRIGMKAKFIIGEKEFTGEVVSLNNVNMNNPNIDRSAGNEVYVIVKPDKPIDSKLLESKVRMSVEISKKDNVIVIPRKFVKTTNNYPYVEVTENGNKEERFIETGIQTDNDIEIISGLKVGEQLIEE